MIRRFFHSFISLPWLPLWLAPTILLSSFLFGGKVLFWGVPYLQFVPWRVAAWNNLSIGELPLWNPLVGMGAPLLANYQSALLYPPNWILVLAQGIGGTASQAWFQGVIVWFHLIWAGIGMALFCRQLGLGKLAQAIGGIAFGLSTYLVSRSAFLSINASVAWLPWVIMIVDRIKPQQSKYWTPELIKSALPLGLVFGLQLLTGHAQITWYTLILATGWVLVVNSIRSGIRNAAKCFVPFLIGIIIAGMLAAAQLIPTAEYLIQSQRATEVGYSASVNYSFWPWRLLTLVSPWFFGSPATGDYWFNVYYWEDAIYLGLLPLLVGILGIFRLFRIRSKLDWRGLYYLKLGSFGVVILVVSFLLAMGRYTPIFPFLYKNVPTFNMFQGPTRWSLLAVFCLALLGGVGTDYWQRPTGKGLYWARLATAGALAVTIGGGLAWMFIGDITPTFIRAMVIAGLFGILIGILDLTKPEVGKPESGKKWSYLLIGLLCVDLVAANWGILPAYSSDYYKQIPNNANSVSQAAGNSRIWINADSQYSLMYIRGLNSESFTPGVDWETYQSYLLPNSNTLFGLSTANNYDPLIPGRYAAWMDRLNSVKPNLQAAMLSWMNIGVVEKLDSQETSGIRFDLNAHKDRFQWISCAEFAKKESEAWQIFSEKETSVENSFKTGSVVILGGDSQLESSCNRGEGAAINIIVDHPQYIKLTTQGTMEGWLVQSDVWYPGWIAKVDGEPAPIMIANTIFRAIPVPAGDHTVEIIYKPISVILGFIISIITLLMYLVVFLQNYLKVSKFGIEKHNH